MTDYPTRDLTFEERTKWGTCPVCGRGQDMPCAPWFDEGVDSTLKSYPVECTAEDSDFYKVNVHEARLSAAPQRVRLVPVEEVGNITVHSNEYPQTSFDGAKL